MNYDSAVVSCPGMAISIPSQKIQIKPDEIVDLDHNAMDTCGRLFMYQGELYRGIYPSASGQVQSLFSSGLISHLTSVGLFPESKITDFESADYPLVIWHERITYPSYANEWCFEMLREAALATLKIREIASTFGYDLVDAHPDNIIFRNGQPVFVDLGSFEKKRASSGWIASERFVQSFYYPLSIWATGNEFLARKIFNDHDYLPHISYFLYTYPWLRVFNPSRTSHALDFFFRFKKTSSLTLGELEGSALYNKLPRLLSKAVNFLFLRKLLPFQGFSSAKYISKISKLRGPVSLSRWAKYHSDLKKDVSIAEYPRFKTIVDEIRKLPCSTATEIGANQGELARLLLARSSIRQIACLDIDEGATNIGFLGDRDSESPITRAVIDIVHPTITEPKLPPSSRFESDIVIALALTHHLLLGQKVPLPRLMSILAKFTNKYIAIEFMPHGFDMTFRKKGVPSWYTEDWFVNGLRLHFAVLKRIELEPNRVFYLGEKLQS